MSNISQYLESHLPPGISELLREIGEAARSRGEQVYLVGGVVRDLLRGQPMSRVESRQSRVQSRGGRGTLDSRLQTLHSVSTGGANLDLDLVVEGDAIALGRRIVRVKNWGLRTHPRFGTAKLYRENFNLDLVTARSEIYAQPGALPAVKPGTIEDDLRRRDFTINAMAACISPDSFGKLLDPHDGQSDLRKGLIRILHRDSFADDPTRILRALRYEKRLRFHLEQDTEDLLRRHLDNLDTVTGERLWHELELILKEERPEEILCRGEELGVLQRLHPALRGDGWLADKFARYRVWSLESGVWSPESGVWSPESGVWSLPSPIRGEPVEPLSTLDSELSTRIEVYLALMFFRLTGEEVEGCIARLKMPGWAARAGRDMVRLSQSLSSLASAELRPSEIYRRLNRHLPEVIEAAAIASDSPIVEQRLGLYLKRLRHVKPELGGDDLQSLGVPPGRKMGQILRALQAAKLDQTATGREEEEALVRRLL